MEGDFPDDDDFEAELARELALLGAPCECLLHLALARTLFGQQQRRARLRRLLALPGGGLEVCGASLRLLLHLEGLRLELCGARLRRFLHLEGLLLDLCGARLRGFLHLEGLVLELCRARRGLRLALKLGGAHQLDPRVRRLLQRALQTELIFSDLVALLLDARGRRRLQRHDIARRGAGVLLLELRKLHLRQRGIGAIADTGIGAIRVGIGAVGVGADGALDHARAEQPRV
mmetsp:Transcript_43999/g.100217  ORF Transcript_43999/g.100217 Transcript_43999/m.100217 type:complete len:232 (-) Transcript_43999:632-1327(-)